MKLCLGAPNFLKSILITKSPPAHVEMNHLNSYSEEPKRFFQNVVLVTEKSRDLSN